MLNEFADDRKQLPSFLFEKIVSSCQFSCLASFKGHRLYDVKLPVSVCTGSTSPSKLFVRVQIKDRHTARGAGGQIGLQFRKVAWCSFEYAFINPSDCLKLPNKGRKRLWLAINGDKFDLRRLILISILCETLFASSLPNLTSSRDQR